MQCGVIFQFTFHYVSTYTRDGSVNSTLSCSFTFHYVSTYTLFAYRLEILTRSIYIPLCFYLYNLFPVSFYPSTDLHSTMFLLIPIYSPCLFIPQQIYIPLCFYLYNLPMWSIHFLIFNLHSTMFLLILCHVLFPADIFLNLHSTMFLLILYSNVYVVPLIIFTFHYVSTYTWGFWCR